MLSAERLWILQFSFVSGAILHEFVNVSNRMMISVIDKFTAIYIS